MRLNASEGPLATSLQLGEGLPLPSTWEFTPLPELPVLPLAPALPHWRLFPAGSALTQAESQSSSREDTEDPLGIPPGLSSPPHPFLRSQRGGQE